MKLIMTPLIVVIFLLGCASTNPINDAVLYADMKALDEGIQTGAPLNILEYNGTPLCLAALQGKTEFMIKLLDAGADINAGNPDGDVSRSPLHSAVQVGRYEAVKLLLERGANTQIVNRVKQTPYQKAVALKKHNIAKLFKDFERQAVQKAKEEALKKENSAFVQAQKENTYQGYEGFLGKYPKSAKRTKALQGMAKALSTGETTWEQVEPFQRKYPEGVKYLQPGPWLKGLGPQGLKVGNISTMLKEGLSENILSAKIKNSNTPYKDFSIQEIKYLKSFGMTDLLIQSMIEATGRIQIEQKRALENKELLAQIQKLIDKSQKNIKPQQVNITNNYSSGGATQASNPSEAVECLKLKAALKACDEAPGFLAQACRVTAQSQFDCSTTLQ